MASKAKLEREVRARFLAAKNKLAANYQRLARTAQLSDDDRKASVEVGLKFMELNEKETKSALLVGRAQNRAKTRSEFAAISDQVIAALEGMIEEFDKLNTHAEEILTRYKSV